MNKLFLLDAMALIYRAHFAFSKTPRINSKEMNTGAVLGFTNTLLDLIKRENPTHIGVAFDTAEPTFRHIEFKEYKAHRDEQPEDISIAIPYVYKMVEAFNIPILVRPGYEADDIIGTIAKKAAQTGEFKVYMMTPDKDYAQLVEENIFLYKPAFLGNDVDIWGIKEVLEKFDIQRVDQVIDLLGLQGDAVDNIPGIPGIGAKTAAKLLKEFDTVEGLIANTDKLKGKQKEKVIEFAEQGILSKRLATIDINVPVEFQPEELKMVPMNEEKVKALFDELEFRTLKSRLFKEGTTEPKPTAKKSKKVDPNQQSLFGTPAEAAVEEEIPQSLPEKPMSSIQDTVHHYYLIDTPELRRRLVKHLENQDEFCFDTETTGIDALDAALVGIAFSTYPSEAYYVPVPAHDPADISDEVIAILQDFRPVFENPHIRKIGQNIKYDLSVLKKYHIQIEGKLFDTMLAHYLIAPDTRHNMDVLAENYLNYATVHIEELIGKKGINQGNMRDVAIDLIREYAGEDADITLQLKYVLENHLRNPLLSPQEALSHPIKDTHSPLEKVFYELETPLIPVLAEMEMTGVRIEPNNLSQISKELTEDIIQLQKSIFKHAEEEFNIDSPRQLGLILFEKLKLEDKPKKTKTGQYATGEEILIRLADKHRIVSDILDYRELVKLKNTYVDALPGLINPRTGRVHTSFNQAVAATGRLSSVNPNLQNIPIRTERGRSIRKAFVAGNPDSVILSADYSQIELRIMAAFSGDETMIEAFKNGRDIHATTAAKIYKVPLDQVDSQMRSKAKTANFGIIYGISAHGLSQRLNIPRTEAAEIIQAYFEEFPAIKKYMDRVVNEAREREFVETIFGRRRYLRNINARNMVERGIAERNAINAPIQGSAADMIKLAMINIHNFIQKEKLRSRMILQVHDELVFEVLKDELDTLKPAVEDLMKNALPLVVPMEIGIGVGENWLEAH